MVGSKVSAIDIPDKTVADKIFSKYPLIWIS